MYVYEKINTVSIVTGKRITWEYLDRFLYIFFKNSPNKVFREEKMKKLLNK